MYYIQERLNQFEQPTFEVMIKEPYKNGFKVTSYSGTIHNSEDKATSELRKINFFNKIK